MSVIKPVLYANAVLSISCTFLPSLLSLYYVTLFCWGPDPQRQPWHCPVSVVVQF